MISIILFTIVFVLFLISELNKRKYSHLDGLTTIPLIGNVHQMGTNTKDITQKILNLSALYGRIYKLFFGPLKSIIVLEDADDFEVILSQLKYTSKGLIYNFFETWFGESVFTQSGPRWHKLRKIMLPVLNMKFIKSFIPLFALKSNSLCDKLQNYVGKDNVNIEEILRGCTLEIIFESILPLGGNFRKENNEKLFHALHRILQSIMTRVFRPWLYFDVIFNLTPEGRQFQKDVQTINSFTLQDGILVELNYSSGEKMISIILLSFVFVLFLISELNKRKYSHLDGLTTFPLLGNVHQIGTIPKDITQNLINLSTNYGRIYKLFLGPMASLVFLQDADDIEVILSELKYTSKGFVYKFFEPWFGKSLFTLNGTGWYKHRKLVLPLFNMKKIKLFIPLFALKSNSLCDKLQNYVGKDSFNIDDVLRGCTLEIIFESILPLGGNFREENNKKLVHALHRTLEKIMSRLFRPWLHLDFIYNLTPGGRQFQKDVQTLKSYTLEMIEEVKKAEKNNVNNESSLEDMNLLKNSAFLLNLIKVQEELDSFTTEDIINMVSSLTFGGHDTSSVSLNYTFYLIAKYQDVQAKIVEELDLIFEKSTREATLTDLQKMVYLGWVIKESMRLYPSVPIIVRRTDEEDIYLKDNIKIPKGTEIMINIERLGKNPKYWSDPEKFDPERFSPENSKDRHPYAFIPFVAGPRTCPGQQYAMLEMKMIVASVLRRFKLRDVGHKLDLSFEIILKSLNGVLIGLDERN